MLQLQLFHDFLSLYTILYYTIVYNTILFYTILYNTILYYTILYNTILYLDTWILCICAMSVHFYTKHYSMIAHESCMYHYSEGAYTHSCT